MLADAQTVKGVLAFLTSPALGSLSDVIGRKYLFLLTVLGTAAPNAALGLGFSLETHLILVGLSGAAAATFPLAFAYIADNGEARAATRAWRRHPCRRSPGAPSRACVPVPPHGRSSAYGVAIGLGLGGAYLVGPPAGAYLNEQMGSIAVFRMCLWITLLNGVLAVVLMREPSRPTPPPWRQVLRHANPFGAFAMLRTNKAMRLLAAIVLFFYLALWGFLCNKGVYARRRFNLNARHTAAQLALFGLVSTVAQSIGLRLARKYLSEAKIVRRCFLCAVLSQVCPKVESQKWSPKSGVPKVESLDGTEGPRHCPCDWSRPPLCSLVMLKKQCLCSEGLQCIYTLRCRYTLVLSEAEEACMHIRVSLLRVSQLH